MDGKRIFADVAYAGASENQRLDVYLPAEEGVYPVILLLHGGAFKFGSRKMKVLRPIFGATSRGFAVVSADYRTTLEATFPNPLADVKAAVRWVRANSVQYGFDVGRIAVWGESAGAYLALMTALTPEVPELDGDVCENAEYSSAVNALVAYYPLVDFCRLKEDADALGFPEDYCGENCCESELMGHPIGDDALTRRSLWTNYQDRLPPDFALKALIQVGDGDHMVPYLQSVRFARSLGNVIGSDNVALNIFPNARHIDTVFFSGENLDRVYDFLKKALK